MLNATANLSTFLGGAHVSSTPIRAFNNRSLEAGSSSPSTYRDSLVRFHRSHVETIEISDDDDCNDANAPQEENVAAGAGIGGVGHRSLRVALNIMSPGYIRDMLNGAKLTQSTRNVNTRNERCDTNAGKHNLQDGARDASEIDYQSWQWQPMLRLYRIDENDQNGKQLEMSTSKIARIEFDDSHASIIRELPPEKATKIFEKRIEVIKQSMQTISMRPSVSNPKRPRPKKKVNVHQVQYEETLKRLQQKPKKRSKNAKKGRKLYTPSDSFEAEKENDEPIDMEPKSKRPRISPVQPIRILPNRAAKSNAK